MNKIKLSTHCVLRPDWQHRPLISIPYIVIGSSRHILY